MCPIYPTIQPHSTPPLQAPRGGGGILMGYIGKQFPKNIPEKNLNNVLMALTNSQKYSGKKFNFKCLSPKKFNISIKKIFRKKFSILKILTQKYSGKKFKRYFNNAH